MYHTDPLTPISLLLKYYQFAQLGILTPIAPAAPGDSREVRENSTVHLAGGALLLEN